MGTPLRVLLIEDDPDDAALIELTLVRGGYTPSIVRVDNAVAMSDALDREPWDLVLSDYNLPSFDGPAALALLQAHDLDIPFIIVSGTVGEYAAVTSMKAGAHDYLNKNNLKRLAPAVGRELQEARRRADHRRAEEQLRESEMRFREHITGLAARVSGDAADIEGLCAELMHLLEAAGTDGRTGPAREALLRIRSIAEALRGFVKDGG